METALGKQPPECLWGHRSPCRVELVTEADGAVFVLCVSESRWVSSHGLVMGMDEAWGEPREAL